MTHRFLGPLVLSLVTAGCFAPDAVILDEPEIVDGPDVILIPIMQQQPHLDQVLGVDEWAEVATIEGTFHIHDGTAVAGDYPFRLRMGADDNALHIAIEVFDLPPNPFWKRGPGFIWYPDRLALLFMTGHEGNLTPPADYIGLSQIPNAASSMNDGYWTGTGWVIQPQYSQPRDFNDGVPTAGRWARAQTEENITTFWEVYIPRTASSLPEHDGLHLTPKAAFRMALVFGRQGSGENPNHLSPDGEYPFGFPHDVYPGDGYTPRNYNNPETWLKFRMPT